MKNLRDVTADRPIRASDLQQLVEAVRELQNRGTGPGLVQVQSAGGTDIALQAPPRRGANRPQLPLVADSVKTLAATQGTQDVDTFDKDVDNCKVAFQVITDIQYDTTTHKLTFRTRTITTDRYLRIKTISAESALVEITTAEEC